MAQTYTWVVEQEFVKFDKRNINTEQWIVEQQIFLTTRTEQPSRGRGTRPEVWEEIVYTHEVEADRWLRQEEQARQMAEEREREEEEARTAQENIRRIEARIRQKREEEKRRLAEERLQKAYHEQREREKRERTKSERATIDAWHNYEMRWAGLAALTEPLAFSDIPWPLVSAAGDVESIMPAKIVAFLFSPLHSQSLSRKEKIRNAQLRWHPDRFQRLLKRVAEEDKAIVEEGVGVVARCLNDLMARETTISRQVCAFLPCIQDTSSDFFRVGSVTDSKVRMDYFDRKRRVSICMVERDTIMHLHTTAD